MAVEAARQIAEDDGTDRKITGYRIENAEFWKALKIPLHSSPVETLFYLRPLKEALEKEHTWSEYRLCVYEDGSWEECCRGRIQVEYESPDNQVDRGKEVFQEALHHEKIVNDAFKTCDLPMATEPLYEMLNEAGAQYGPAFRVLSNLWHSGSLMESAAEVELGKWTERENKSFVQPCVFHPTTLDGVFQIIVPALSQGGRRKIPTLVPSRIGRLWISAFELADSKGPPIRASSRCQFRGYRETVSSVSAVSSKTNRPCFILEDLESTIVGDIRSVYEAKDKERQLCYSLEWKPDLDMLSCHQTLEYCESSRPKEASPKRFYKDLRLVTLFYITDTVARLAQNLSLLEDPKAKYLCWMKEQLRRYDAGEIPVCRDELNQVLIDCANRDTLIQRVQHANKEGKLFVAVGTHLFDILCGKVDPLGLLFEGDLVKDYYQELNSAPQSFAPFATYLEALTYKNPSIMVLEIGAGTGGATLPVLEALASHGAKEKGSKRYSHYDFTDISPGFFERAKERFKDHEHSMSYKVLDIEIDPYSQGFQKEEYDLILASNVSAYFENIVTNTYR